MRLGNARDLGRFVRDRRRAAGLTQTDLASRAAVSRRWLADLEGGKATVEVGLVFKVISALGMFLDARPEPTPEIDIDAYLDSFRGDR
jgi:HTH-type transcriptional regulator/antitoxin HipB